MRRTHGRGKFCPPARRPLRLPPRFRMVCPLLACPPNRAAWSKIRRRLCRHQSGAADAAQAIVPRTTLAQDRHAGSYWSQNCVYYVALWDGRPAPTILEHSHKLGHSTEV